MLEMLNSCFLQYKKLSRRENSYRQSPQSVYDESSYLESIRIVEPSDDENISHSAVFPELRHKRQVKVKYIPYGKIHCPPSGLNAKKPCVWLKVKQVSADQNLLRSMDYLEMLDAGLYDKRYKAENMMALGLDVPYINDAGNRVQETLSLPTQRIGSSALPVSKAKRRPGKESAHDENIRLYEPKPEDDCSINSFRSDWYNPGTSAAARASMALPLSPETGNERIACLYSHNRSCSCCEAEPSTKDKKDRSIRSSAQRGSEAAWFVRSSLNEDVESNDTRLQPSSAPYYRSKFRERFSLLRSPRTSAPIAVESSHFDTAVHPRVFWARDPFSEQVFVVEYTSLEDEKYGLGELSTIRSVTKPFIGANKIASSSLS